MTIEQSGRQSGTASHTVRRREMKTFEACLSGPGTVPVRRDASVARALGITGTPTFLFGLVQADGSVKVEHRLSGAKPIDEFRQLLNDLLSRSSANN